MRLFTQYAFGARYDQAIEFASGVLRKGTVMSKTRGNIQNHGSSADTEEHSYTLSMPDLSVFQQLQQPALIIDQLHNNGDTCLHDQTSSICIVGNLDSITKTPATSISDVCDKHTIFAEDSENSYDSDDWETASESDNETDTTSSLTSENAGNDAPPTAESKARAREAILRRARPLFGRHVLKKRVARAGTQSKNMITGIATNSTTASGRRRRRRRQLGQRNQMLLKGTKHIKTRSWQVCKKLGRAVSHFGYTHLLAFHFSGWHIGKKFKKG
jgi:hypothetical protein